MRLDLYRIAHAIQKKIPFLWRGVESVNGWLFMVRYGSKMKRVAIQNVPAGYRLTALRDVSTEQIETFFRHQPEAAFTYFRPPWIRQEEH